MPRGKRQDDDLDALNAIEAKLTEQLADITRRKSAAHDRARDAGRASFLSALDRVKVGPMEAGSARAIAKAIEALGGDAIAARLANGEA